MDCSAASKANPACVCASGYSCWWLFHSATHLLDTNTVAGRSLCKPHEHGECTGSPAIAFRLWKIPASLGCPSLRDGAPHRSRTASARHSVYSSTTKRWVVVLSSTSSTQTTPSIARRYAIDRNGPFRLLNEHRGAQSSSEANTRTNPSVQAARKCVPPASARKSASSKKLHGRRTLLGATNTSLIAVHAHQRPLQARSRKQDHARSIRMESAKRVGHVKSVEWSDHGERAHGASRPSGI